MTYQSKGDPQTCEKQKYRDSALKSLEAAAWKTDGQWAAVIVITGVVIFIFT